MEFWMITGGAASGKSQFCDILQRLQPGSACFSADAVVRRRLAEPDVARQIETLLGSNIIGQDLAVDREKLRDLVFRNEDSRRKLEGLLHPMVYEELTTELELAQKKGLNLFLAEVPLYYESGQGLKPDRTLLVAAQVRIQTQRIIEKRGLTDVAAARIIQAQLPLESKITLADAVVWNEGGIRLLEMQAEYLLQQIHPNHVH